MSREQCRETARSLGVKAAEMLMRGECEPSEDALDFLPPLDLLAERFGYVDHSEISGDLVDAFESGAGDYLAEDFSSAVISTHTLIDGEIVATDPDGKPLTTGRER